MKNKGLILTLAALSSLLVVGCNKQSSEESFNDSTNDKSDSNDNNQALYNRIIRDYYEQRVSDNQYVTSVYRDFPYSSRYAERASSRTIDNVVIEAIWDKTNNSAYFVGMDLFVNKSTHINHYENCNELNSFYVDGKEVYYPYNQNYPFDVWCNGTIYYPLDAVYSGIITIDELLSVSVSDAKIVNAVYDASSPILNIDKKDSGDTFLKQIQKDFYDKVVAKSDVLDDYCSDPKDIHIVQTFASSNNIIVPEFAIDNYGVVPFYTFCDMWNSPLMFDGDIINAINAYIPVIYVNHSFLRIDEAFEKECIDKQIVKEILNKLPNHNAPSNRETYPYEENQNFYNRVIMDYYEQKVLRPGCVNKFFRKGLNNYEYYNGVKMEGPNGYVTRDFRLPSIGMLNYGKSSNGAYLFLFSDERYSANDGYTDVKDIKLIIDGSVFHVNRLHLPFVWYKGLILFLSEAYYIGLISKEDIQRLLYEKIDEFGLILFDPFACPLSIKDRFEIDSKTPLYELKNDYYQYLSSSGVSSIDGSDFSQNDVHIIEYYGRIDGKEMVSVQTDNVAIQNCWENNLVIDEIRFDKYQPMIHFNKQFYTIREAYENNVLNNEELLEMSEFLNSLSN